VIRVIRIVGESYDLESGQKLANGIILSNGVSEFMLHVDDEVIIRLLEMQKESTTGEPFVRPPPSPEVVQDFPEPLVLEDVHEEYGVVARTFGQEEYFEKPELGEVRSSEDYSDPGTGVASL